MDLEEQIRKYEEEMAEREANPSALPKSSSMANLTADGKQDLSSLANLQNVGNAQKIIDLLGQEIFVFLQSPMWQERDQALQSILGQIDEFMSKD